MLAREIELARSFYLAANEPLFKLPVIRSVAEIPIDSAVPAPRR